MFLILVVCGVILLAASPVMFWWMAITRHERNKRLLPRQTSWPAERHHRTSHFIRRLIVRPSVDHLPRAAVSQDMTRSYCH